MAILIAAGFAVSATSAPAIMQAPYSNYQECIELCFEAYPGREWECSRSCQAEFGINVEDPPVNPVIPNPNPCIGINNPCYDAN
jgi:hypothetical protein